MKASARRIRKHIQAIKFWLLESVSNFKNFFLGPNLLPFFFNFSWPVLHIFILIKKLKEAKASNKKKKRDF
jgi:hypothetical protein